MIAPKGTYWILAGSAAVALATFAVYAQTARFDFVRYDDGVYVTENEHVLKGVTWDGLVYAFTTGETGTWQPLALVSHMIDCELFGTDPAGHHLVSAAIHALNTFLLGWALYRMTGAPGPSLFVAGVFGLHPMHVESVAWVSERKDVLSTLFFMLTLLAYVRYVERPVRGRYVGVVVLLALGLMAKPMLVTLPLVLLLLDCWPLRRVPAEADRPTRRAYWVALALEKFPLFGLAFLSCVITLIVQHRAQAISSLEALPIGERVTNALMSYYLYVEKTFVPAGLATYYPHPRGGVAMWRLVLASAFLVAVSGACWIWRRERPYAMTGWLWYLVTLVPVIGIVQVGTQAMADRYSYIPMIGISVFAAWWFAHLISALDGAWARRGIRALAVAILAVLAWRTRIQAQYWKDSETLFRRAIAVTTNNEVANMGLAITLLHEGRLNEAIEPLERVIAFNPNQKDAYFHLGLVKFRLGRFDEALTHYQQAIAVDSTFSKAWNNLGNTLFELKEPGAALDAVARAVASDPSNIEAIENHAKLLVYLGRFDEAEQRLRSELERFPGNSELHYLLGVVLNATNRPAEAARAFREALRLDPDHAEAGRRLRSIGQAHPEN